jgi:hypothetical protein
MVRVLALNYFLRKYEKRDYKKRDSEESLLRI